MAAVWRSSLTATTALLLPLLLLLESCVGGGAPVVRTRQGAVRGTAKLSSSGRHTLAFYNIPFAKPPVGPLRFKSPEPPAAWEHIRDATTPGPSCSQLSLDGLKGSEDCLYLNVFTPELRPKELLPVMVWIHGGGFMEGSATTYEYGYLMDYDVVVVAINYRLGPLGFLSTGDEASPGNYGFKDQVAALRWVKENIEAFGGDPGSVTIFGESAGGASTHYLMLSPLAKGLFHRSISQSGVALSPWAISETGGERNARKLAALVGCPVEPSAALVDCLRNVDDYKLAGPQLQFAEWGMYAPLMPFQPVVEADGQDAFLPRHPAHLAPHTAVPWLVGVTKEEGTFFAAAIVGNDTMKQELLQERKRLFPLVLSYDASPQADFITEKINDFYFPSGEITPGKLTELFSDAFFVWNTDEGIRKYKDTAPVYYYLFSYKGKLRIHHMMGIQEDFGICHAEDLLYLFSNNTYLPIIGERPENDMQMVKVMTKLWTDFARTGNPTPTDELVNWPRVTSDDLLEYLDIGQTLQVKKGLFQERVDFWRSLPLRETQQQSKVREEL
ncbi:fatty acyl-CoA hydrolase precursor, medium chain-like isoform X4 [Schistocerca gregaria]|uniref:fatty acyl-CoA hydrolase precursor, medium chain-like isoform X3 n=1 Tax=Schistocerca gregaria TaxID=7010 RepID=UPI00211EA3D1|nr:fatty acyl-CoA hydrolase precursor, medium chain-like isoform X3 [Schistocerca gregaria]XP_049861360.1 fatty acyl-CoA hydrolase precursor, medium chain-like isoform X4 [Schistocerca gregaria]